MVPLQNRKMGTPGKASPCYWTFYWRRQDLKVTEIFIPFSVAVNVLYLKILWWESVCQTLLIYEEVTRSCEWKRISTSEGILDRQSNIPIYFVCRSNHSEPNTICRRITLPSNAVLNQVAVIRTSLLNIQITFTGQYVCSKHSLFPPPFFLFLVFIFIFCITLMSWEDISCVIQRYVLSRDARQVWCCPFSRKH